VSVPVTGPTRDLARRAKLRLTPRLRRTPIRVRRHADPALERFGERGLRVIADALRDLGDAGVTRNGHEIAAAGVNLESRRRAPYEPFVEEAVQLELEANFGTLGTFDPPGVRLSPDLELVEVLDRDLAIAESIE
jgi:hypothetical protein